MKFSQYDTVTDSKDGIILFNFLNSKYVKINKEEDIEHFSKLFNGRIELSEDDDMVRALYQNGYIVDDSVNEYEIAKKEVQEHINLYSKYVTIMLYVTDQCNFRCVYCPEKHIDNYFSDKHYEGLYKFLKKGVEEGRYTNIKISFFGGEPLICADKIILFLEKLEKLKEINKELTLCHHITTNAYLLTPEIYDKLVALNVLQYQITVDGFEETHNKTRPLAGGQGSWDKIIENLKYINTRNDSAIISLRANYNNNLLSSLVEFKKWEQETFDNPKFRFLYEPIAKFSDRVPDEYLSDMYSDETLSATENVRNMMSIFEKQSWICESSYPNNYTIGTDGRIAKCNNVYAFTDDMYIGYLSEEGEVVFNDNRKLWEEGFEMEICKECTIYPICCARTCPAKKAMNPIERTDCKAIQENFTKRMLHFAQNKM